MRRKIGPRLKPGGRKRDLTSRLALPIIEITNRLEKRLVATMDLHLFVLDGNSLQKIAVNVSPAVQADLAATVNWQTQWTSASACQMPNKVALRTQADSTLLGLMAYELDPVGLAVEIVYVESAAHSNANLLRQSGQSKKYIGIARALFAYAVQVSMEAGFDGVLYFKAKTDELREYYIREFGASPVGRYDPYRLVIWEDAAQAIVQQYQEGLQ